MTNPNSAAGLPAAAAAAADLTGDDENTATGPTVGAADARADEARSGADTDLGDAARDSDGVPVGSDDADADVRASGADPDKI